MFVTPEEKSDVVDRCSVKPVSLLLLSDQLRSICEPETTTAVRSVGAVGVAGGLGGTAVGVTTNSGSNVVSRLSKLPTTLAVAAMCRPMVLTDRPAVISALMKLVTSNSY